MDVKYELTLRSSSGADFHSAEYRAFGGVFLSERQYA